MISERQLEICDFALEPMATVIRINGPDRIIEQYNNLVETITKALEAGSNECVFVSQPMSFVISLNTGEVLNVYPTAST